MGASLSAARKTRTVKVWDAESGHQLRSLEEGTLPVTTVALSADGSFIVNGLAADRTVKVWDRESGRLLRSLKGHIEVTAVALSR